ncbi:hypothetical protein GGQ73_004414 [Rhizobium skierniewicense]|uniref:Uncharacterized protein n=1 Tax=Rhizobium skierniewicense TaxID=984260 RepID=A0A7W6G416_9HYPH|nr:hypothetical protein [Rhizobium skierniewicense]MBB3948427.1 hypothetical protein [Rhizobium skierniewicense]
MGQVFNGIKRTFMLSARFILWSLRMAAWKLLTFARGPVTIVCGFTTVAGWVGGVVLMPALLWYANAYRGSDFGFGMFGGAIAIGLTMGLIAPVIMVKYDSLLFRLQPEDRITIYT